MLQRHPPNDDALLETKIPNVCIKQESQIPSARWTLLVSCRHSFQLFMHIAKNRKRTHQTPIAEAKPRTSSHYVRIRPHSCRLNFVRSNFRPVIMNPSSSHHPRGHIVHPWELAMLVHNYDRQRDLQQQQLSYLRQAQGALRRAAPVILELLDAVGPNIPNYAYLHEPRELLTQMQQRLTDQEQRIQAAFQTPPSPYIPNDDYGFLRRPESRIPAPTLRRSLCPRSRSAPAILTSTTTSSFGDQPWYHVPPQDYMDIHSTGTTARFSMQTRQTSDEMDTSS